MLIVLEDGAVDRKLVKIIRLLKKLLFMGVYY